ncbi:hypothetical protein DFH07DRAFT_704087, partial [Mycena maculata]
YYDDENITESTVSFRMATGQPVYHRPDDHSCMRILYGVERGDPCVQEIGSMIMKARRVLSYPNLFQHRVSSSRLRDPSRPGHRKILQISLVNPAMDRIPSATDIPPQQADRAAEALQAAWADPASLLSRLPQELIAVIVEKFPTTIMRGDEARAYRSELVVEHT